MCFNNDDYDWHAEVMDQSTLTTDKLNHCDECYRDILPGTEFHYVHMRQHEECQLCVEEECDCDEDQCCQCDVPEFGEEQAYSRCIECDKFLQAVQAAEVAEGCPIYDSRPGLNAMEEEMMERGRGDAKKYFVTARKMFPELVGSGYLKYMWNKLFSSRGG